MFAEDGTTRVDKNGEPIDAKLLTPDPEAAAEFYEDHFKAFINQDQA